MGNNNLYSKVKFVNGRGFTTIEDTSGLSETELIKLIELVEQDPKIQSNKSLNILVNDTFSNAIDQFLVKKGFLLHDENVMVYKDLENIEDTSFTYEYKTLKDISETQFMELWEQTMRESLNATSILNVDDHMRSVEIELEDNYKDSCCVAYEKEKPIGIVMPHIEPGTKEEGRLFYFGLLSSERGKGKSRQLHLEALHMLKRNFKAAYYIGSTSSKNIPMLKTFERNGCTVKERNRLYKKRY